MFARELGAEKPLVDRFFGRRYNFAVRYITAGHGQSCEPGATGFASASSRIKIRVGCHWLCQCFAEIGRVNRTLAEVSGTPIFNLDKALDWLRRRCSRVEVTGSREYAMARCHTKVPVPLLFCPCRSRESLQREGGKTNKRRKETSVGGSSKSNPSTVKFPRSLLGNTEGTEEKRHRYFRTCAYDERTCACDEKNRR